MTPTDTRPEADAVQFALLRAAGTTRRAALAIRLSSSMIRASRRAVARRHPELSAIEQRLLWVELHYGAGLAAKVRARIATSRP